MNEFLLWFLRPIAEFLGVMFLLLVVVGAWFAFFYITQWWGMRKKKNKV